MEAEAKVQLRPINVFFFNFCFCPARFFIFLTLVLFHRFKSLSVIYHQKKGKRRNNQVKSYKRLFCCYESNNHSVRFFFLIWPADGAQLSVSVMSAEL